MAQIPFGRPAWPFPLRSVFGPGFGGGGGSGGGGGGGTVTINNTVQEITASGLSEDTGQVLTEGTDGGALLLPDDIRIALDGTLGGSEWRQAEAERLLSYDAGSRTVGILAGTGTVLPLATPSTAGLMSAGDQQTLADAAAQRTLTVIEKAASATLLPSERFALIRVTGTADVTLSVVPGTFGVGESVTVLQSGSGTVSFAAGGGASIASPSGLTLAGPHAIATMISVAADEYVLVGALSAT